MRPVGRWKGEEVAVFHFKFAVRLHTYREVTFFSLWLFAAKSSGSVLFVCIKYVREGWAEFSSLRG